MVLVMDYFPKEHALDPEDQFLAQPLPLHHQAAEDYNNAQKMAALNKPLAGADASARSGKGNGNQSGGEDDAVTGGSPHEIVSLRAIADFSSSAKNANIAATPMRKNRIVPVTQSLI
jgi:hypothetical protein